MWSLPDRNVLVFVKVDAGGCDVLKELGLRLGPRLHLTETIGGCGRISGTVLPAASAVRTAPTLELSTATATPKK